MSNKWEIQHNEEDTKVKVTTEYNRTGAPQTDFLVIEKKTGKEIHTSADMESGKVIERHGLR